MLLVPIVFHYFLLINLTLGEKNVEITLIKHYMEQQIESTSMTSFLCWDIGEIQKLSELLHDKNIMLNAKRNNLSKDDFISRHNSIFLLDFSCEGSEHILLHANESNLFIRPNHWLIFLTVEPQFTEDNLNHIFSKVDIVFDSRVVLFQRTSEVEFTLKYIYKLRSQSDIILDKFGQWTYPEGFVYYQNEILIRRRKNFQRTELRTAIVAQNNDTLKHMLDYRFNEIDTPTKLTYLITLFLGDYLNATLSMKYYPTWSSPTGDQNNTLIGPLITKEIDISGTPFFCRIERLQVFECIAMTSPVNGFFIFRQPPLSYVKNIFALPFDTNLWLINVSFILVSSILLYTIVLWEWRNINETNDTPEVDMIHATYADALLFTMGAVCQQGYATEPKGGSGKVLMLTIFVTLIFLFTAYSAYTVVLFQSTSDDIQTLDDLYNSKIVLGMDDKHYFKMLLPYYTEPVRRKIYYDKIMPPGMEPHVYPLEIGMEKVRTEYFGLCILQIEGYNIIHETFMEHEKCDLKEISFLQESNAWVASPKNSSFKDLFKVAYSRMLEAGLNQREFNRRIPHKPSCSMQVNSYRSAGILDLYSVYMLLIIGVGSSLVLLIFEITCHAIIIYRAHERY